MGSEPMEREIVFALAECEWKNLDNVLELKLDGMFCRPAVPRRTILTDVLPEIQLCVANQQLRTLTLMIYVHLANAKFIHRKS